MKQAPNALWPAEAGFRGETGGVHTSRTIMLEELRALFESYPEASQKSDYQRAIVQDNALAKATHATRKLTAQRLSELYGLDRQIAIFRALRYYWERDSQGRPLLALLAALARDALLRQSRAAILDLKEGDSYDRQRMTSLLKEAAGDRLNPSSLDKVARNAASSWTQSGHLQGRTFKVRQLVHPSSGALAFALYLGYLQGVRGDGLLRTLWCRVLDRDRDSLLPTATEASRYSLLRLRYTHDVFDVSFPDPLTPDNSNTSDESYRSTG